MAPRLKLFAPLFIFALLALLLFRGLSLDPREMPSALIDKPLPEFELFSLGEERMLSREDVTGQISHAWGRAVDVMACTIANVRNLRSR